MSNKKTQKRQTRNQDQIRNRPYVPPDVIPDYSDANNIVAEKDKSKKKKRKKSQSKPVIQSEAVQPVVPKIARPNPLEVKARAAARAAERAAAAAVQVPKRKPPLKPRGARVRVEPPPEPPAPTPVTVKRMMPKPKPRTRQTRKTYTSKPVNMAEFMMESNKPMKRSIPRMSRKSPAFFNIPNGTNELRDAVTEVANSFRLVPRGSMNPLLREPVNHPLLRGSFMTRKRMSEKAKGQLNVIKE